MKKKPQSSKNQKSKNIPRSSDQLRCSFCGKNRDEVRRLIEGSGVYICDECIDLCNDIIAEEWEKERKDISEKHLNPSEIIKHLNKHIIGQNSAKNILAAVIYKHYVGYYSKANLPKSNILLVGPPGVGKTLMIKTLSDYLDVPIIFSDATKLTRAGYLGSDPEGLIKKLIQNSEFDIDKAERGIVFIDHIDKISYPNGPAAVLGLQESLLNLFEGTEVEADFGNPQQESISISTDNILFICAGTFSEINHVLQNWLEDSKKSYKFKENKSNTALDTNILNNLHHQDFIEFGFVPDFIGRLPVVVFFNNLTEKDLINILVKPENSIIKQYQEFLKQGNIEINFTPGGIKGIAKEAKKLNTGAWGLQSVLDKILVKIASKNIPKKKIKQYTIDQKFIKKYFS